MKRVVLTLFAMLSATFAGWLLGSAKMGFIAGMAAYVGAIAAGVLYAFSLFVVALLRGDASVMDVKVGPAHDWLLLPAGLLTATWAGARHEMGGVGLFAGLAMLMFSGPMRRRLGLEKEAAQ